MVFTKEAIKPYVDTINAMLGKGCKFKEIECAIQKMGYSGAASTIRMYATRQQRLLQIITQRVSLGFVIYDMRFESNLCQAFRL